MRPPRFPPVGDIRAMLVRGELKREWREFRDEALRHARGGIVLQYRLAAVDFAVALLLPILIRSQARRLGKSVSKVTCILPSVCFCVTGVFTVLGTFRR